MHKSRHNLVRLSPSCVLAGLLLTLLFLAGGSARADVLGQMVVRVGAWMAVIACILLQDRTAFTKPSPVFWLGLATFLLVAIQLIPLPPAIWTALPGRAILVEATAGFAMPWRPISIVPGATFNALSSLVVPFATFFTLIGLRPQDRGWILTMLFGIVVLSMLIGLIQFSGVDLRNPLVNGDARQVSGLFANRNHFALFMAMGCVIAPAWASANSQSPGWRLPLVVGLLTLFLLMILASGSRAGLVLGGIALFMGGLLTLIWSHQVFRRFPRWVMPLGGVLIIGVFIVISVASGRAISVERLLQIDQAQDMRSRAFTTVLFMAQKYFPFGSGFGSFDPAFRIDEPFNLLKTTYFNHAHNDFLEVVLEGGLPSVVLLLAGLWWWGHSSLRAVHAFRVSRKNVEPLLGAALLLLLLIASLFDYPARTPIMMAVVVIAATWLADTDKSKVGSGLPGAMKHL